MPQITVAIWNIQEFGSNREWKRGFSSVFLNNFIAALLEHLDVDVLAMMEVLHVAAPSLASLQEQLAARDPAWRYDWIKGALREENPANADDLSWSSGVGYPRQEGYALFWKHGNPSFTVLDATAPVSEGSPFPPAVSHKINLVTHGLEFSSQNGIWGVRQGYVAGSPFPVVGAHMAHEWPRLNFISVSHGDPLTPLLRFTRRPAFTILRLHDDGGGELDCPLLWFHAPSRPPRNATATGISGLSRELFVVPRIVPGGLAFDYTHAVIAGGDFNLAMPEAPAPIGEEYERYTRGFADNPLGGAACDVGLQPRGEARTTVQLNEQGPGGLFNGPRILSNQVEAYLHSTIDQIFHRIPAPINVAGCSVVELVQLVMNPPPAIRQAIQQFHPLLMGAQVVAWNSGGWVDLNGPGPIGADGNPAYPLIHRWDEFIAGVAAGAFATARTAAEFIHIFISDHLPVAIRLNW